MSHNQHKSDEGHWESHSYSSSAVKIGDNPAHISGKEASAEGTFNHGKPVVTDSHATSFTNEGHPNRIEYKDEGNNQQKSIK